MPLADGCKYCKGVNLARTTFAAVQEFADVWRQKISERVIFLEVLLSSTLALHALFFSSAPSVSFISSFSFTDDA
jgi:hypothetical protein